MSHTFNNDIDGSCTTRSIDSAYEPASGVTIMGYGGICSPRNLAENSIEYFNLRSFDQALKLIADDFTGEGKPQCGTLTNSNNTPPTVTVSAGDAVRFVLRNHDPIAHEWIVGDDAVHAHHRDGTEPAHGDRPTEQGVPALGFVRTTVTFEEPGEYAFICHLPGHEAYGMAGTVIVTGG